MTNKSILTIIAEELGSAFQPLSQALESQAQFTIFLGKLGWDTTQIPPVVRDLVGPLRSLSDVLDQGELDASDFGNFANSLLSFIGAVRNLATIPNSAFAGIADPGAFKNQFPQQLIEYLLARHFLDYQGQVGEPLRLAGIIREEEVAETAMRPEFSKLSFALSDIIKLFSDPLVFVRNAYGWGTVQFKGDTLFENIQLLLDSYGIETRIEPLSDAIHNFLNAGAAALKPVNETALRWPLLEADDDVEAEIGIALVILPQTGTKLPGVAIVPYGELSLDEEIELSDKWALGFEMAADIAGGIIMSLRPVEGVNIQSNILNAAAAARAGELFAVKLISRPSGGNKTLILGSTDGSRFEASSVSLTVGGRVDAKSKQEAFVELKLNDASIVINPAADSDSFIANLVPSSGFTIDFSLIVGLSTKQGLYFGGSGGLEINFPAHINLGPIEIESATLALKPDGVALPIDLGATFKADLGPLKAVVENIGLSVDFSFPESGGNLGPIDLSLGFKPPNGVGLSIDTGVIKGGGYLYFDSDKEEYAGALELVFSEFLTLKAIGLITTRMPDGSKGFSLLIIITAEFGSPIQLSFGFTLSAVGGLLGLHRTMRLQPLVDGVRTGAVNSVMFPTNVVENAPRIISDLRTFFPPQLDIFLIGPMAKIGWGTPNLVTLSLGIIIEIPGDIAILGVLKVALPDENAKLLILQVNFLGAIEFGKKRAWLFASLYESRVLSLTIEGQIGVLVAWGDNANFVVTVGGFHPAFNPPPLPFPEPKRIAVSILNTSTAKIRVEGYFAVTSNTAQFGARAELFFGLSAFKIDGYLAFDALFQFSPFYFIISISASLSVKVFGIGLFSVRMRGSLEGPTPWHVEGTGSISILFFDIDVDFSRTWGKEADTTLPRIEVMPLLKAEYEKLENWRAIVPAASSILVSLRKIETTDELVLHPVGTLRISQRAVPLDLTIDKVGAQKPKDANCFTLSVTEDGADPEDIPMEEKSDAQEKFAMAQFKELTDSKKLSAPAFENLKGGVELSVTGEQYKTSSAIKRVVRYEQIIIDTNYKRYVQPFFNFFGVMFKLFLKGNAVTKSKLSDRYKKQKMPFSDKITVIPNTYGVAFNTDNSPLNEEAMAFTSYAQAEEYMNQKLSENPNLEDSLHVIPQVEMTRAV